MIIARHDKATMMLSCAVTKGKHGGDYMIGDFGKLEELKELGIHSKRVPSSVLPDSHVPAYSHNGEDGRAALPCRGSVRDKMA